MVKQLVLSLFPGIGLLDMAFEQEGFCVVRGPDLLWGGDVRRFHPPSGRFDGVIGGPPCQTHSTMKHLAMKGNGVPAGKHGDQIPEFRRIIEEAEPAWFLMENVPAAYDPAPDGYAVTDKLINNRWFGQDQNRRRRFWFGWRRDLCWNTSPFSKVEFAALDSSKFEHAVLAGHGPAMGQRVRGITGRAPSEMCRLQGLPENFTDEMPFTVHGKKKVIGNGVPLPMGRAIAKAIKATLSTPTLTDE